MVLSRLLPCLTLLAVPVVPAAAASLEAVEAGTQEQVRFGF